MFKFEITNIEGIKRIEFSINYTLNDFENINSIVSKKYKLVNTFEDVDTDYYIFDSLEGFQLVTSYNSLEGIIVFCKDNENQLEESNQFIVKFSKLFL